MCSIWSASDGPCPPARRFSGDWDPPLIASCAVGVTRRRVFSLVDPPRVARGVCNNENPGSLMTSTDVGSSNAHPLRVIPERGQVPEYTSESPENRHIWAVSHTSRLGFHKAKGSGTQCSLYVFPHDEVRSDGLNRVEHRLPQAGPGAGHHSRTLAGQRQILTGASAADHVHVLDPAPVDAGDVPEIRRIRVAVREDLHGPWVDVAHPRDARWSERQLNAYIQSAVTREQRSDCVLHASPPRSGSCSSAHGQYASHAARLLG